MTETEHPQLKPVTIAGTGLRLAVHGLAFEVDANATVRVAPSGHISVAIPGDPLGHVLVRHGFEVMEAALDVATATKLAQLLRGEVVPEKKISAPPAPAPPPAKRPPIKWVPTRLDGPVFVTLGSRTYRVPEDSQIKFNRGVGARQLAYVMTAGRVHLLSSQGEGVLLPHEATGLARNWQTLRFEEK